MNDFGEVEPKRHYTMSRIRSSDTKPEITLRQALWKKGYRYRKNWKELPGTPDIVFRKYLICIFVDGELFHGYGWENGLRERLQRGRHSEYWVRKIERNMERDRIVNAELHRLGWKVLRFWGKDVERNLDKCIIAVDEAVSSCSKR